MTILKNKLKKKFDENGFIIIKKFFNKKKTDDIYKIMLKFADKKFSPFLNVHRSDYLIAQCNEQIQNLKTVKEKSDFIQNAINSSIKLKNFFLDIKIDRYLKILFGKKCVGLQTQYIFKRGNTTYAKVAHRAHQDSPYASKNGKFFTAHIFLKKTDLNNGTIYLYPGSHKLGELKYKPNKSFRGNIMKPGNEVKLKQNLNKINIKAEQGDLLVMHGLLVHGSYPNLSKSRSRPVFCGCYIPKGENFFEGKNADRKIYEFKK